MEWPQLVLRPWCRRGRAGRILIESDRDASRCHRPGDVRRPPPPLHGGVHQPRIDATTASLPPLTTLFACHRRHHLVTAASFFSRWHPRCGTASPPSPPPPPAPFFPRPPPLSPRPLHLQRRDGSSRRARRVAVGWRAPGAARARAHVHVAGRDGSSGDGVCSTGAAAHWLLASASACRRSCRRRSGMGLAARRRGAPPSAVCVGGRTPPPRQAAAVITATVINRRWWCLSLRRGRRRRRRHLHRH